jgi:hypothetical protein
MAGDKNIERVWAIVDKAGICMLTTRFDAAFGPASSAVAAFEFAKARPTGEKPSLGENRKATVEMS